MGSSRLSVSQTSSHTSHCFAEAIHIPAFGDLSLLFFKVKAYCREGFILTELSLHILHFHERAAELHCHVLPFIQLSSRYTIQGPKPQTFLTLSHSHTALWVGWIGGNTHLNFCWSIVGTFFGSPFPHIWGPDVSCNKWQWTETICMKIHPVVTNVHKKNTIIYFTVEIQWWQSCTSF